MKGDHALRMRRERRFSEGRKCPSCGVAGQIKMIFNPRPDHPGGPMEFGLIKCGACGVSVPKDFPPAHHWHSLAFVADDFCDACKAPLVTLTVKERRKKGRDWVWVEVQRKFDPVPVEVVDGAGMVHTGRVPHENTCGRVRGLVNRRQELEDISRSKR